MIDVPVLRRPVAGHRGHGPTPLLVVSQGGRLKAPARFFPGASLQASHDVAGRRRGNAGSLYAVSAGKRRCREQRIQCADVRRIAV